MMWLVAEMLMLLLMRQMILMTGYALHLLPQVRLERLTIGFKAHQLIIGNCFLRCKSQLQHLKSVIYKLCKQNILWKSLFNTTIDLGPGFLEPCDWMNRYWIIDSPHTNLPYRFQTFCIALVRKNWRIIQLITKQLLQ